MAARRSGRLTLVVNPAAGRGAARRWLDPVLGKLRAGGREVAVIGEDGAEATTRAAREAVATGTAGVIGLGGDGLAHLLLQLVAGTGVPLGLIPAGTGNDLAAGLGVPADPIAAAAAIAGGRTETVDAGRVAGGDSPGRWWASILCTGFDSQVTERANAMRFPRGPRRYDLAVLAEVVRLRPHAVRLTFDGEVVETDVILVAVGNTASYGGGIHMCPTARPDDGAFDVTVIGPATRRELVRMLPKVRTGTHLSHPAVTVRRVREVGLASAEGPLTAYADGERMAPLPVTTRCERGALTVFVA